MKLTLEIFLDSENENIKYKKMDNFMNMNSFYTFSKLDEWKEDQEENKKSMIKKRMKKYLKRRRKK